MTSVRHFLLLTLFFVVCGDAMAGALPVRDFFKHAKYQDIEISPDGRYLAATVPIETETRLAVIDRTKSELLTVFSFGKNKHVISFDWVSNERLIMRTAIKIGSLARPASRGDLWAADANGKHKKKLLGPAGFSITDLLHGDDDHILVTLFNQSNFADIYRIDVNKDADENLRGKMSRGKDTREMRSPVRNGSMLTDNNGKVRFVVGNLPDGTIVSMYRDSEEDEWREVGRYDPVEGSLTPRHFHPDNRRIYMSSTLGATTSGLVLFDPDSGEMELLFRNDRVDLGALVLARDRKTVIAVGYQPDRPTYEILEPEHPDARILSGLISAFPGQAVGLLGFTDDGTEGLVIVYSDKNPGEFFVFNTEKGSLSPLVKRQPWINPAQMASRLPVAIPTRDGLTLHGYLTAPSDGEAKNLPLIVLSHGGPHGVRDTWSFQPEAQFFANRGFAVLQVNFRGSGGYGREFLYSGYQHWGDTMQDDLTDSVLWAVDQGIVDRSRVCIYGASYGGYAALMSVVREPDLYKCSVGYAGIYDMPLMFKKGDIPKRIDGMEYLKRALGQDEAYLAASSPAFHVEKIKAKLFLVHGKEDIRAHFQHYKVLAKALDRIGKPYESMVKAKEEHGFYDEDNTAELYTRMLAFFDQHIGVGASQAGR